jgi:hypothetical protein
MTAVIAELVVGGLLSLTWLTLFAMSALGPSRVTSVSDNSSLSAVFLVGLSYALGVVFDRVWDVFLDRTGLDSWIRRSAGTNRAGAKYRESDNDRLRRNVYGNDPKNAAAYVEYNRGRMRVARACSFNFPLITIAGLLLIGVHFGGVVTKEFVLVLCAGSGVTYAAWTAYKNLRRMYDRVLRVAGGGVNEESVDVPTPPAAQPDASVDGPSPARRETR